MSSDESYQRLRDLLLAIRGDPTPGDRATIASVIHGVHPEELTQLLRDFIDAEVLAQVSYELFELMGGTWPSTLRQQLAEALVFQGHDREAGNVLASLR